MAKESFFLVLLCTVFKKIDYFKVILILKLSTENICLKLNMGRHPGLMLERVGDCARYFAVYERAIACLKSKNCDT